MTLYCYLLHFFGSVRVTVGTSLTKIHSSHQLNQEQYAAINMPLTNFYALDLDEI